MRVLRKKRFLENVYVHNKDTYVAHVRTGPFWTRTYEFKKNGGKPPRKLNRIKQEQDRNRQNRRLTTVGQVYLVCFFNFDFVICRHVQLMRTSKTKTAAKIWTSWSEKKIACISRQIVANNSPICEPISGPEMQVLWKNKWRGVIKEVS